MIVKELSKQIRIKKMEALVNRIPLNNTKYDEIKEGLRKLLAGFNGERAISYYLDYLPEKDYFIFHNLRLPSGKYHFQIDYLVLTSTFALILECKNFYGTLFLEDSFEQLIRTANEKEEGFQNPISQAKWHQQQLYSFLQCHGIPPFPIEYLVAISNPSTILKTNSRSRNILKRMVHGYNLLDRIKEWEGQFKEDKMDLKGIRKLSKLLLKSHVPEDVDILDKFRISKSEIITGVQCSRCKKFAMIREHSSWFCPKCAYKNKDGHIDALNDYFLLLGNSITNREFRDFVHLSSESVAKKLLTTMNLPFSGSNKGRIYYKP